MLELIGAIALMYAVVLGGGHLGDSQVEGPT